MAQMNMIEAIRSALDIVMDKDPNVVVLGEDVGYFGGVFRCTDGLQRKYGEHRVIDAPIAEGGIIGAAIGIVRAASSSHRLRSARPAAAASAAARRIHKAPRPSSRTSAASGR
jgi:transketolase C-terminal domain/subunit